LQLKQGDPVEILEKKDGFLKVRYRIDGDFPVDGWIPEAAISSPSTTAIPENKRQLYEAEEKALVETEVKSFPSQSPSESVKTQMSAKTLLGGNKAEALSPLKMHIRPAGPWLYEGYFSLGHNSWHEALRTKKEDTMEYGDAAFLEYDVSGIYMGFSGKLTYQYGKWELGGLATYGITFFRGSVPTTTTAFRPGLDQGNVQALLHEFILGPYARYPVKLHRDWMLYPEIRLLPMFNMFSTNQLKSTDNVNPGVPGQSALYSFTSLRLDAELAPELHMPFNLRFTPSATVTLFNLFSESPIVTSSAGIELDDSNKRRTGSPDGSNFGLGYGAKLAWNLKSYGWETFNLIASYKVTDYSKNYKGVGNRAGVKTIDVKSTASSTVFSFGAEYFF